MTAGYPRARFEVDEDDCIGCGLCRERAPHNLEMDGLMARVYQQPRSAEDEAHCHDAAEYCPTGGLRSVKDPGAEPAPPATGDVEA